MDKEKLSAYIVDYKNILHCLIYRGMKLGWTPKEKDIYDKLYDWYIQEVHKKADK